MEHISEAHIEAMVTGDHRHLTHAWPQFGDESVNAPLIISHGIGSRVFDVNGKEFLDGMGGLWCVNMGYGRQEIADAIAEQARRLPYYNPSHGIANIPALMLAEKIALLTPGDLNHVFFTCGGSTANDSAIRLIHYYQSVRGKPSKRFIITRERAYHGSTYLTGSMGGSVQERSPHLRFETELVKRVATPNCYRRPADTTEAEFCDILIDEMENKIAELGADTIAAYFAEPILGSGGVIVPPPGYNRRMWELCRANDILYVSDEVVTAFGRIGHYFVSKDMFDIQPDMIVFAKGITSGYQPLGGFAYSDRIHKELADKAPRLPFANGYTYTAHPIACAAALATIDLMERDGTCAYVRENGPYFEQRLGELTKHSIIGDVRGTHFMMCIEAVGDKATKQPFAATLCVGERIAAHAAQEGLLIRDLGNMIILSPPLIITKDEIDKLVRTMSEAIARTARDLDAERAFFA